MVFPALHAAEIPFSSQTPIQAAFDFARSVASADFDRDGDLDLVAVASLDDAVAWFENTAGDGSAWSRSDLSLTFANVRDVAVGDLDGDGDSDIVATAFDGSSVSWWENDLSSTTVCGSDFCEHSVATLFGADAVEVVDLDGDGDLDIVATSRSGNLVRWYANAGDGTGWASQDIGTVFLGAQVLEIGDLDGDGDLDVLGGAGNSSGEFAWWENDLGSGAACGSDWCEHSLDTGITPGVGIGDLDGDGDLDLLRSEDGALAWWENVNGDGSSWTETTISATRGRNGLAAIDVDGDGDLDVVGLDSGGWLENLAGDASSWTERSMPGAPTDCFDVEIADLDGDGDLDVAAARNSGDRLVWWRAETLHRSVTYPTGRNIGSTLTGTSYLVAADFDGDGDDDVAVTSTNGTLRWSENDGTPIDGGWVGHPIYIGSAVVGIAAADLDGDGDIDLAACDVSAQAVRWFENDGTPRDGGWEVRTVVSGFSTPIFVAAGDLDADGDVDLVVSSQNGDSASWFENDGTPGDGEWTGSVLATGLDLALGVDTADLDGDGDLDVLAAAATGAVIAWVENDGTPGDGGWSQHTATSGFGGAIDMAACDLDADGDLDIVAVAQGSDQVAWLENDGTPAVGEWPLLTIQSGFVDPYSVVCADLDADGDLDVAATAGTADDVSTWLSDGSPGDGGWQRLDVDTSFDGATDVVASDLDRDGRIDLVATAFDAGRVRWWHNGGGQLALPTTDRVASTAPLPGAADLLLLEIEGAHRGRVADDDAELATLELEFEEGANDPLTGGELDALVDTVRLYLDDGDGIFEPDTDDSSFFSLGSPFTLDTGVLTLTMVDGDPNVQLAVGSDLRWWLAVDLTAGAADATPDTFRVTHLTSSSSTGEMSTTDLPLSLEEQNDVSATQIDVNDPPTLDTPIGDQTVYVGLAVSLDVGSHFSDPDGIPLAFVAGGLPSSLTISTDGLISGTPTLADTAGSPYSVTVTAADSAGITAMDTFDLTVLPNGTIVVDGTCTLTDAILSANTDTNLGSCTGAGGLETIVLDVDVSFPMPDSGSSLIDDAYAALPDITSEMRIEAGLGSTITRDLSYSCLDDGLFHFRLFNVLDAGGLTLVGLTLENGCARRGGAVHVGGSVGTSVAGAAGGYLAATGSTFRGNAAQGLSSGTLIAEGGAIFVNIDGDLALDGCLFEDNRAEGTSSGFAWGGAVGVRNGSVAASIVDSDFTGNLALGGSGAVIGGGAAGGAIYSKREVDFEDLLLVANEARGGEGTGGANAGDGSGGAVQLDTFDPSQILGAVFWSNLAVGGDSTGGVAGDGSGGAIFTSGNLTLAEVLVVGGGAHGGDGVTGGAASGGGLNVAGGVFTRVTIAEATASGGSGSSGAGGSALGGGLYSDDSLAYDQVTLSGNLAEGGNSASAAGGVGEGGGAFHDDDTGTISHLTAIGNSAIGGVGIVAGSAAGGGMHFTSYGKMVSSILADNTSAAGGGAATADDCSTTSTFDSLGYNVAEAPGTCTFAATGDQSGVDPGVLALGRYGCTVVLPDGGCLPVHPIDIGGAAVDQGSCTASGATVDARGFARPFDLSGATNADDGCDAGAYEVQDANGNGIDDGFEIFADGFESGSTSAWSATAP